MPLRLSLRPALVALALLSASALTVAEAAPATAQEQGPRPLLSADGALNHARHSARLVDDVAGVWESGEIPPPTMARWTREALGVAAHSLALIDSARALPRAGGTSDVQSAMDAVQDSLRWGSDAEVVANLRRLAHSLSVLDGGPSEAPPQVASDGLDSHQREPRIRVWREVPGTDGGSWQPVERQRPVWAPID